MGSIDKSSNFENYLTQFFGEKNYIISFLRTIETGTSLRKITVELFLRKILVILIIYIPIMKANLALVNIASSVKFCFGVSNDF